MQKYEIAPHIDPETGEKHFLFKHPGNVPVPSLIGVLIGETCYNLRSSLDYFIFELAQIDSGKRQRDTQFPIEFSQKKFDKRAETYLRGVNASHIAQIEQLQPYRGCVWTKRLGGISNQDKHQEFATVRGRVNIEIGSAALPNSFVFKAPFGDGQDMNMSITTEILFKNGVNIINALDDIKTGVSSTLEAFRSDIEAF